MASVGIRPPKPSPFEKYVSKFSAMIRLLPRNLHLCSSRHPLNPTHLRFLYNSIPNSPDNNPTSLTISFLICSCGLSMEAALSASKKFHLKSEEKPNAVLAAFKDLGFTKTQIASIITKLPNILSSSLEKTIKPKLEFFLGVGYPSPDLAKLVSADPHLLRISLEKRLVPNFDRLKSMLGTREAAISALSHSSWLLCCDLEKVVLPNIKILRDYGVPEPKIVRLATKDPRVLMQSSDRFGKTIKVLKELGFNPLSTIFVSGISAMSGLTVLTWERKLAVYKSLGWSEKETILAFTKNPYCMLISEEKIRLAMDFFVKKLHLEPSFLSARPMLLLFSLEKRIIPRCAVLSVLLSKGLVRRNLSVQTMLMITEKKFLEKYVMKYQEEAPEVLEAYHGKMDFVGLEKWK